MSVYRRSAATLLAEGAESVVERLTAEHLRRVGHLPTPGEQAAWAASLPVLASDLVEAGLGAVELLVEHPLPLTSRRADVVLAGAHPDTGASSYVVVELKQWTEAHAYEDDASLVVVPGARGGPRLHPAHQVAGYVDYLTDHVQVLHEQGDAVAGVAYLHKVEDPEAVADIAGLPSEPRGALFTAADREDLHAFLRSRLSPGAQGGDHADRLLDSPVGPSTTLLAVAADELRERTHFRLIGEQQLAVEHVLHAVERARSSPRKRTILITGGPGSGKSAIALSVLGELARQGRTVLHATGSRSFTQTLRRVAGHRAPQVKSLFQYFNQFAAARRDGLEVLLLDEAHRIRQTSASRFTRAEHRTGRAQVDELLDAARVPVFLLDQHQVVRPGEIGSPDVIRAAALRRGHDVVQVDLPDQFRCGGSEAYVTWVHRLLGLTPGGPVPWAGDDRFTLDVAEAPEEMEQLLASRRAEGYSARMAAGYCWAWSDPTPGGLVPDVRVGRWARPWNVKGDRRVGDAPPAALWATDDGGFGQVGCIYTAQGFEYDWAGVIVGPDLVWRGGRLATVRGANRDPDLRNRTRVSDADFDRLVRNVYKVLLTRGMRGAVLYATDPETREVLRRLVET